MSNFTLQSPAKLNLYLKVLNKRPDGFHNISTLFQRINLFDDIQFKKRTDGKIKISCNHPHVPIGPKNLVYKVAQILQKEFNIADGVDFKINKRIPVAAGLAGGSSNAATALLGLNRLWKLDLTTDQLVDYARQIGSDVAFFLYDTSWAIGTNKGDRIKKIAIAQQLWHILVVPKVKMYSWKVYGGLNLKLTNKKDNVNILIHDLQNENFANLGDLLENDLENEIIRLCPKLLKLKDKLKGLNVRGAMISGSGPSVFGITDSETSAQQIRTQLIKRYSQVFVVRTL